MRDWIVSPLVSEALDAGCSIVALESALITHGLPYPANLDVALQMMERVRQEGAVPAVIGMWQGRPAVGLSETQVATLAQDRTAIKVSLRDLPLMAVRGTHGGTTVAATMVLAHLAGIQVFATGGIGGVHRGHPQDVSADLPVLARTPMVVVCSGAKAILDLPMTLETLETNGVPVLGWESAEFPAFYSRASGLSVDCVVREVRDVVTVHSTRRMLGLSQAILVTVPVPAAEEVPAALIEPLIAAAVAEADRLGITGRDVTPFLLAKMADLTSDATRRANESLLVNNARCAAQIAIALAAANAPTS